MEHTKHLFRAVLLLIALGTAGIVTRHFLIPPSFGLAGPYRYDALKDLMGKPVVHGSLSACQSCHQELFQTTATGKHASVACEVCHAALNSPEIAHVKGEEKNEEMPSDRSVKGCLYCHGKVQARPQDMPQVDVMQHLTTLEVAPSDGRLEDGLCITCHDAHAPSI